MAKNSGDNHRHGAVCNRSQAYNPKNDSWVKRVVRLVDLWMLSWAGTRLKELLKKVALKGVVHYASVRNVRRTSWPMLFLQ